MRLLDRIHSEGFVTGDPKINLNRLSENLGKAQLVVIDNVAAYYSRENEKRRQSDRTIVASDFPNIMLPFDLTFLDMRPRAGAVLADMFDEAGVLMEMFEAKEWRSFIDVDSIAWVDGSKGVFCGDDVVSYLTSFLFARDRFRRQVFHVANYVMPVNAQGQIVSGQNGVIPWTGALHFNIPGYEEPEKQADMMKLFGESFVYPGFLALSFMHCRNVKVVTERPPEKLSRKHQRKTGQPLLKYRLLQIDHMKQVLEREGKVGVEGLKHALHICRGHFKRYGYEGRDLLFGKHKAIVWRPMEVRGKIEKGVVVKDYDVK